MADDHLVLEIASKYGPEGEADSCPRLCEKPQVAVLIAVAALGLSSVVAQLALMRELLCVFAGNEMVLGVILGNWLLLTGLGAWLGRLPGCPGRGERATGRIFLCGLILVAVLPPAGVFAIRALRNVVFLRGATIGVAGTVLSSLAVLLPFCLISGVMLVLACDLLTTRLRGCPGEGDRATGRPGDGETGMGDEAANVPPLLPPSPHRPVPPSPLDSPLPIGWVYVADSVGSVLGGAMFTFLLVRLFDHFALLCLPAAMDLGLVIWLAARFGRPGLAVLSAILLVGLAALNLLVDVDAYSTRLQYPGQRIIFRGQSPYGRLLVAESAGQYNFIENGLTVLTTSNVEQVEETVHYAMAQRPAAHNVLLVGGGISGTAMEILKYPVDRVTYVELDPLMIQAGRTFLSDRLADRRIDVVNTDGRLFISRTGQGSRFDVVIVDVPDPSTSQINRFYTREFFDQVHRVLTPGGVLSIGLGHYENYVSPELGRMLGSARRTLLDKGTFSNVLAIPGGRVFLLASDGPLHEDIAARIASAGIATRYVNHNYLDATMTPDRMAAVRGGSSAGETPAAVNTDFNPVLYYYHLRHWMSQFRVATLWLGLLAFVLFACLAMYLLTLRPAPLAIFASGFAGATLEIVLLLAYQMLYGSIYRQVGLIVTIFMAGLAVGAGVANRTGRQGREEGELSNGKPAAGPRRLLAGLAVALAVVSALTPAALTALGRAGLAAESPLVGQAAIGILTFLVAALVGVQFPVAGRTLFEKAGAAVTASRLYTADFVGATIGALLASTLLIPLVGMPAVCFLTAGLNLLAGAMLLIRKA